MYSHCHRFSGVFICRVQEDSNYNTPVGGMGVAPDPGGVSRSPPRPRQHRPFVAISPQVGVVGPVRANFISEIYLNFLCKKSTASPPNRVMLIHCNDCKFFAIFGVNRFLSHTLHLT